MYRATATIDSVHHKQNSATYTHQQAPQHGPNSGAGNCVVLTTTHSEAKISAGEHLFKIISKISEQRVFICAGLQDKKIQAIQSSEDILHQTIDLLSKRVLGIEKRQQSTLESIAASQRIMQQFPENIESSLREGLAQELRPAIRDLVLQTEKTHEANQSFIQHSSQAQVDGIDFLINSVQLTQN